MSQRDSGYARKDFDLYDTPEWVSGALSSHLRPGVWFWEPAAGNGAICSAMSQRGFPYHWASDIQEPEGLVVSSIAVSWGKDFLLTKELPSTNVRMIITNPPYTAATEFIEHALDLMKPVKGLVAMLLRTDFDHAGTRRHLFADHPAFAKKIVLTNRIKWFEGPVPCKPCNGVGVIDGASCKACKGKGEKEQSPSENHSWWIWDWQHRGWPVIVYEGKQ